MEEQLILSKPRMELQVTIIDKKVRISPLPSCTMKADVLYTITHALEATAYCHLVKLHFCFNHTYSGLLVFFSNQGWLIKQVDSVWEVQEV